MLMCFVTTNISIFFVFIALSLRQLTLTLPGRGSYNEWVAPASMVRANPILFRRLEQARRSGTPVSGVAGFADGGMAAPSSSAAPSSASASGTGAMDPEVLAQLTAVLKSIIADGVPAYVLLSELNSKQELHNAIKKKTGKK